MNVENYKSEYLQVFNGLDFELEYFEPNQNIVFYDREIIKLRYLVKGKAKIYMIHEDGKRSIIHFVKPHEYIGELSLIGIEKTPKDVVAICKCTCLSIHMDVAKKYLLGDPEFLLKLNQYVGKKLLDRTWFNAKSLNYELKNRLAAYILMTENDGVYKEKHTETADFLSVSYRHLLHTIKHFLDEGLLIKIKKGYQIDSIKLRILEKDID